MPNGLAAVILVVIGCTLGLNAVAGSPLTSSNPLGQFDVFARDVAISSGCSTTGTASCHNTSAVSNLCCFESPGGLILQTQFWDTDPSTGPSNSWTIHGLWPDNCDGTFPENCDPSRDQSDITTLLENAGAQSTLSFMQTFWKNDPDDGSDEELWSHEWDTHGTCYSTLEPSCLPSGSASGTDAVAFFETVIRVFQTVPTYTWLENQGITPSSSTTHTLTSLLDALKAEAGVTPMLTCDGSDLDEIAWYFNLKGSLIDGVFLPIDSPESSDCPSSGIKYPLKTGSPVTTTSTTATTGTSTTTTTTTSTSTGAPGALPTKAMVVAIHNGAEVGGLLTLGTWSTQTLGTMTLAGTTSSFTMTSSKGNCGVSGGELTCGSGVTATTFTAVSSGGNLLVESGGSTAFSSSAVPSGETVETVFTGSGKAELYTLAIVAT